MQICIYEEINYLRISKSIQSIYFLIILKNEANPHSISLVMFIKSYMIIGNLIIVCNLKQKNNC